MPVLIPLDPIFKSLLESKPVINEALAPQERRAMNAAFDAGFMSMVKPGAPLENEREFIIAVDGGEIRAKYYAPEAEVPLACIVYFHGGGWWLGTLEQAEPTCRRMASDIGCVVISVDYRLAPECKFPTAAEDCYTSLCWIADNAALLGIDPERLAVGGVSAGGNLAAVSALMARDRGGPGLKFQLLEFPAVDLTRSDSLIIHDEGIEVPSVKAQPLLFYLTNAEDGRNPYASPLMADDLTGLPPALIMAAEYDDLRLEAEGYANALRDAGSQVDYLLWKGHFHGSHLLDALVPDDADKYHDIVVGAMKTAFN